MSKKATLTRAMLEAGDITLAVLRATEDVPRNALAYYHKLGLFRLRAIEDSHATFSDLCGDSYNPEVNPDIPAAQLAREKATFRSRVTRQGVWGVVVEVRSCRDAEWADTGSDQLDSIWGFVGGDFLGSGYEADLLSVALEALEKFPPEATDPTARLIASANKALHYLQNIEVGGQAEASKWLEAIVPLREALQQFEIKL